MDDNQRSRQHMLQAGEFYRDLGGEYFRKNATPNGEPDGSSLSLKRFDHKVSLEPIRKAA
jgi:hypothetical protein